MKIKGHMLLARALAHQQVKAMFYLMGGPMLDVAAACKNESIRMVDVRHEQAAAMMAHAYARVTAGVGICMACSGPGTINLTTGVANAMIDCAPLVAIGGASPLASFNRNAFQEVDQLAVMRPVTKWAERVYEAKRIPEYVDKAFGQALSGRPGPVYLDFPGDILYQEVEEVEWKSAPAAQRYVTRPAATTEVIAEVVALLKSAQKAIVISGSGILWSKGGDELGQLVRDLGIPIYTTPQGRGVIPEDEELVYASARSTAMKEADVVIVAGTRLNYVFSHGKAPRFSPTAKLVQIDIDPGELTSNNHIHRGILGDVKTVVSQIRTALKGQVGPEQFAGWRAQLKAIEDEKQPKAEAKLSTDQTPIHPLRLCKEVRDFMDKDTILVVDGQEILNYGRQSIPTFKLGNRLNSGPFGIMGVGLPFGVGAKVAAPDKKVIVLHGDGSFGLNAMEIDTAIRHNIPVLVIISLNGGWTGDPDKSKTGRDLGYTRFDQMAQAFGGHGEYVERPDQIRPALERAAKAVDSGKVALVNVVTDWKARAQTAAFSTYMT